MGTLIFSTNTFEVDSLDFIADTCRYVAHSEEVPYVYIFMKPDPVNVRQILANTGFCLQPESDIGCGYMLGGTLLFGHVHLAGHAY